LIFLYLLLNTFVYLSHFFVIFIKWKWLLFTCEVILKLSQTIFLLILIIKVGFCLIHIKIYQRTQYFYNFLLLFSLCYSKIYDSLLMLGHLFVYLCYVRLKLLILANKILYFFGCIKGYLAFNRKSRLWNHLLCP